MKLKVGLYGAAGYTGGELMRLLVTHPDVQMVALQSSSQKNKTVGTVHKDLAPLLDLKFTETLDLAELDTVFLCCPHGAAADYLKTVNVPNRLAVIDLSTDHRAKGEHGFIYGLPELNRPIIQEHNKIANPGCFATTIQLALLPLAAKGILADDISITAITGSTGAGRVPGDTTHFSWRANNLTVYKAFNHQHLAEIYQSITQLQPNYQGALNFVPMRGPFTRGIFCSTHFSSDVAETDTIKLYKDYYGDHPFVFVSPTEPDLKSVINSNFCQLSIKKYGDKIHIISCLDNLIKGAVGQAVQNMNLIFGFQENLGLILKSSTF